MKLSGSIRVGWLILPVMVLPVMVPLVLAALLLAPGCGRGRHRVLEVAYVSAPQAALRDQVAAIYNRVGNVKNGERVEVLEREKRFARVRTASGIEGWIEQRFLVDQKTYRRPAEAHADNQNDPVQAPGVLRNETNLHVTPGRETEHLVSACLRRESRDPEAGEPPRSRPALCRCQSARSTRQ